MSISEVTLLFEIEPEPGYVNADLIRFKPTVQRVELFRDLPDTSLQFFIEETDQNDDPNSSKIALLKVGSDVYYPLDSSKTLIYKLENNIYLFIPSPNSNPPNLHLAVILDQSVPQALVDTFNDLLEVYGNVVPQSYGRNPLIDRVIHYYRSPRPSSTPSDSDSAEVVGSGIVSAAQSVASGVEWLTGHTSQLIHHGGSKLRTMNIPKKPTQIDPKVISILRGARIASGYASSVVEVGASAIHAGTAKLGEAIAPVITEKGSRFVSHVTGMNPASSKSMMSNLMTVGSCGFQAFGIIAGSLTESVVTIGKSIAKETVHVVSDVFGSPVARATDDALQTAGNVASSYRCIRSVRPKAMIKKTAASVITSQVSSSSAQASNGSAQSPNTVNRPFVQEPN